MEDLNKEILEDKISICVNAKGITFPPTENAHIHQMPRGYDYYNMLLACSWDTQKPVREKTLSRNAIENYISGIMSMLSFKENSAFQSEGGRLYERAPSGSGVSVVEVVGLNTVQS
jgi:hypothetical protein